MTDKKAPSYSTGGVPLGIGNKFSLRSTSLPTGLGAQVVWGGLERPIGAITYVDIESFENRFKCRINSLPQNICALGWETSERRWYCAPKTFQGIRHTHASHLFHQRSNESLLALLVKDAIEPLKLASFWFLYCFYDGWRERNVFSQDYQFVEAVDVSGMLEWHGAPGEIPVLSPDRRWVGCFGAHRGDPSALLLPDLHYLIERYQALFKETEVASVPWENKSVRAILAASDHGENRNLAVPPADSQLHPRRLFAQTAARECLPIDVFLGRPCSREAQIRYRFIADVDGFARTWDAWAWKMMSGSCVLAVESIWESFFSKQFQPWEHYVPVANDCSDLSAKLNWCHTNDQECRAISERARARAKYVYSREVVAETLRMSIGARLADKHD
jgi:Glycosyl transferase family 90